MELGTRANYDADQALTETRAAELVGFDLAHAETPFVLYFPEASTGSATPATLVTKLSWWWAADYVSGLYLYGWVNVKVSSGTGTLRLKASGGSFGEDLTFTGTSYAPAKIRCLLPTVVEGPVSFQIDGFNTGGGTTFVKSDLGLAWYLAAS